MSARQRVRILPYLKPLIGSTHGSTPTNSLAFSDLTFEFIYCFCVILFLNDQGEEGRKRGDERAGVCFWLLGFFVCCLGSLSLFVSPTGRIGRRDFKTFYLVRPSFLAGGGKGKPTDFFLSWL